MKGGNMLISKWFFTADEHYYHQNKKTGRGIIQFCNRPFGSVEEMNEQLIERHNNIVPNDGITVHVGDFSFGTKQETAQIIKRLNGTHIFLQGDHDRWISSPKQVWQKKIDNFYIVCCHWPFFSWPRSHYGSWNLYGHHHGRVQGPGKSMDVGVDTNEYFPYPMEDIIEWMKTKPENPGLIKKVFDLNQ